MGAEVCEHQDFSLYIGQCAETNENLRATNRAPDISLDVNIGCYRIKRLGRDCPSRVSLMSANGVHRLVVRQDEQPGAHRAPTRVVRGRPGPHGGKDLLDDVLREVKIVQDVLGEAVARRAVSVIQL